MNTYDIVEETGNEWHIATATSAAAALRDYFDLRDGEAVGQEITTYSNDAQTEKFGGEGHWEVREFGGDADEAYLVVGDTADADYEHRYTARPGANNEITNQ